MKRKVRKPSSVYLITLFILSTAFFFNLIGQLDSKTNQQAEAYTPKFYKTQTIAKQDDINVNVIVSFALPTKKPKTPQWFKDKQFKKIASFVIQDLEGGDKIAHEPNGGIAKYGFNSLAHPNLDVKNLTQTQAYKLARKKYYDSIEAEKFSDTKMKLVAFDTAFQHGVSKARKLIKKSNGCAETLIKLRKKEYERLVKANPKKYRRYQEGWNNRLIKVKEVKL